MSPTPNDERRRSGLWIGIGAFALFALVMAGASFLVLSEWSTLRTVTQEEAERSFAERLAAIGETPAYLEIDQRGAVHVRRELEGAEAVELEALHVLAWEPEEARLLQVDFPFWFVRMKMTNSLNLGTILAASSRDWGNLDLKVTEEDLQRRGRGLVLDHRLAGGQRVLLWNE